MDSILGCTTCPQCGFKKAIIRSEHEYQQELTCLRCGCYSLKSYLIAGETTATRKGEASIDFNLVDPLDDNGEIFDPAIPKYKLEKDGSPMFRMSRLTGYGMLYLFGGSYDDIESWLPILKPLSPEHIKKQVKELAEDPDFNPDMSCFATWDQQNQRSIVHFGTSTPTIFGIRLDLNESGGLAKVRLQQSGRRRDFFVRRIDKALVTKMVLAIRKKFYSESLANLPEG